MGTYTATFVLSAQQKNITAVLKYQDFTYTSCSVWLYSDFFSLISCLVTQSEQVSLFGHSLLGVYFKLIKSVWNSCHYITTFKEFPDRSTRRRKGEPGRYSINKVPTPCTQIHYLPSHIQLHIRFITSAWTSVHNVYSSPLRFHLIFFMESTVCCCFLPCEHYHSFF